MEGHNIDKAFSVMITCTFTFTQKLSNGKRSTNPRIKAQLEGEVLHMTKLQKEGDKDKKKCCN